MGIAFLEQLNADYSKITTLKSFKDNLPFASVSDDVRINTEPDKKEIKEKSIVRLVGQPDVKG